MATIGLARSESVRPCQKSELAAFESTNRIGLPNDYRQFLAMIGNGGAGPFYGLARLNACDRCASFCDLKFRLQ
jgi:hypothetical protein